MAVRGGCVNLLFIASDAMEFRGLLARAAGVRRHSIGLDWVRSGKLGEHDAMFVANGVGAARAAAGFDAAIRNFPPDAVISTGFCGALDPDLCLSDVVVGEAIIGSGACYPALPVAVAGAFRSGPIYSSDRVVRTSGEKRELRATGACAVEMEAVGIAERTQKTALPFYCVRVVTDLADEDMVNDFGAALRDDGHFDTMVIVGNALRHPSVRVPELIRLRNRCARATRALGDFFAGCRF
jgi:adenosylhomocysteine nucleosidase